MFLKHSQMHSSWFGKDTQAEEIHLQNISEESYDEHRIV